MYGTLQASKSGFDVMFDYLLGILLGVMVSLLLLLKLHPQGHALDELLLNVARLVEIIEIEELLERFSGAYRNTDSSPPL